MTHIVTCGLHYCLPDMDVEDNTMQIYGPARDARPTTASYEQRERGGESGAVVLRYSLVC